MSNKQNSNTAVTGGSALLDAEQNRNVDELVCEIRRQANQKRATWPCILLKDLLPLCDEYDRLKPGNKL